MKDEERRRRILRVAVTRCESGRYPSAARIAELVGVADVTVRIVLRQALDRASRLLPIAELATPPDNEDTNDALPTGPL